MTNMRLVGFAMTAQPERAKKFYSDVVGLTFVADDGFALVFTDNGHTIRIAKAEKHTPAPHTILGWEVDDIYATIKGIVARGGKMEQFGLPFMKQDDNGVWDPPSGGKVAWFKDPDGNTLSLSQSK